VGRRHGGRAEPRSRKTIRKARRCTRRTTTSDAR
jgi:hypothetical protein